MNTSPSNLIALAAGLVAGCLFWFGALIITIGIHDYRTPTEDSRVVWICSVHGNQKCGPDQPAISVEWSNILHW